MLTWEDLCIVYRSDVALAETRLMLRAERQDTCAARVSFEGSFGCERLGTVSAVQGPYYAYNPRKFRRMKQYALATIGLLDEECF